MMEKKYRVDWKEIEEIVELYRSQGGWTKELNLVSWNGDQPKYDVRWWNDDKTRLGKGFTFTKDELEIMYDTLSTVL